MGNACIQAELNKIVWQSAKSYNKNLYKVIGLYIMRAGLKKARAF